MLHAHARLARTRWLRPLLDLADLTDIEWRCADGEGEGSGTTLTQTDNNGRRGGGCTCSATITTTTASRITSTITEANASWCTGVPTHGDVICPSDEKRRVAHPRQATLIQRSGRAAWDNEKLSRRRGVRGVGAARHEGDRVIDRKADTHTHTHTHAHTHSRLLASLHLPPSPQPSSLLLCGAGVHHLFCGRSTEAMRWLSVVS